MCLNETSSSRYAPSTQSGINKAHSKQFTHHLYIPGSTCIHLDSISLSYISWRIFLSNLPVPCSYRWMNSVKIISFCFISARISELRMGDGGNYLGPWGPWNKDSILSDCHRHTLADTQPSARSLWIRDNDNLLYHPNGLYGPLLSQGNCLLRFFVPPEWYRKKACSLLPQEKLCNLPRYQLVIV